LQRRHDEHSADQLIAVIWPGLFDGVELLGHQRDTGEFAMRSLLCLFSTDYRAFRAPGKLPCGVGGAEKSFAYPVAQS
jgi:hypothetical protein